MPMDEAVDAWEAAQPGAELLRQGLRAEAAAVLQQLSLEQPDNEYAFFFLGCAHFEGGQYLGAFKAFLKALELKPSYLGALLHLGHTLRMLGRYGEAIRAGREILARNSDDEDALYLLGLAHHARGDTDASIHYLTRYLETNPELEIALEIQQLLQELRGPEASDGQPRD